MKRLALLLVAMVGLGFVASTANAKSPHHYYQPVPHHHYVSPYRAYYVAPVVRPPVLLRPQLYVPAPAYYYYYPSVYPYRCYEPLPHYGFYYQGRGVSLGIGF
jgi:hypothetical protein